VTDSRAQLVAALVDAGHELTGGDDDYAPLLDRIGDARIVLLGEASRGTHEFHEHRVRITKRLIEEHGFNAVAVDADWADSYRVNRWLHSGGRDRTAAAALQDFRAFPRWRWRNRELLAFIEWLKAHNDPIRDVRSRVGFYGLDFYGFHSAVEVALAYLDRVDAVGAMLARQRYGSFELFGDSLDSYGTSAALEVSERCEAQVVANLVDLRRRRDEFLRREGLVAHDAFFAAEQNVRAMKNGAEYYRALFHGRISSWNQRNHHLADTLDSLLGHLEWRMGRARVVVWAHNSLVGDARATEMVSLGRVNLGQVARERNQRDVFIVGFTTHTGTVAAAFGWNQLPIPMRMPPALEESWEAALHEAGAGQLLIDLRKARPGILGPSRLERAIGVIYRPENERHSHYFHAALADQFDAVIHCDETRELELLDPTVEPTLQPCPV